MPLRVGRIRINAISPPSVQMRHALQSFRAFRNNEHQSFHHVPFMLCQPTRLKPENSAGERAVDG
jgi:hypothetical protein